jgi:hypothetical protein
MTVSGKMLHVRWRANSVELLFTFDCQSWFIHVCIHYIISKQFWKLFPPKLHGMTNRRHFVQIPQGKMKFPIEDFSLLNFTIGNLCHVIFLKDILCLIIALGIFKFPWGKLSVVNLHGTLIILYNNYTFFWKYNIIKWYY